jgi:NAD(P)-dependent dehydrogenase (short-subunit alcohol dehydrogenase family)
MKLDGRFALITGAGQGIGAAIASTLVEEGAWVAVNDINAETASTIAASLVARRGRAIAVPGDVSNRREVERIFETTVNTFSRLDILVNNAGIETSAPFLELTEEEFDRVIAVDLKGVFLCSQAAAKAMQKSGGGDIINITSICAQQVWVKYAHYCAAKAGADMLTKAMAAELAPLGIRVNGIAPGTVDTEMAHTDLAAPGAMDWVVKRTPAGRIGKPEDIAQAVLFLIAEAPDWMIGDILTIDGGYRLLGDPPQDL